MERLVRIQQQAADQVRGKVREKIQTKKRAEIVEHKKRRPSVESRKHATSTVELESKKSKIREKTENEALQLKIELHRVVEVRAHACVYIRILNWSRRGVTWHTSPIHVPVALLHAFTVNLVVFNRAY